MIFYAAVKGLDVSGAPLYALTGGVLTAVAIGYLMYATAVRINLATFFAITGTLLILVAAGIFKYGVHAFQEAGVLPGMSTIAYHAGDALGSDRWYAALLSGMFNITPEPTWLEIAAWIAYGVPVLVLFLGRKPAPATAKPIPAPAP